MQILREFLQFFKLFNFFLIKLSQLRFRIFPIYLPSSSTYEAQRCLIEKEKRTGSFEISEISEHRKLYNSFHEFLLLSNLAEFIISRS